MEIFLDLEFSTTGRCALGILSTMYVHDFINYQNKGKLFHVFSEMRLTKSIKANAL